MTTATRFGVGLVLGGLVAGSVILVGGTGSEISVPPSTAATTTTSEQPAPFPFIEEGEVVFGTTVLLPRGLEVEDGVARFVYGLAGLSPSLSEHEDSEYGDVVFMPELWELTTGAGLVIEATTGSQAQSVRFELPSASDTVSMVELVGWRLASTFGDRVELATVEGETGSLRSGQATVETVLEQRSSTIVQIDFDSGGDEWGGGLLRPLDRDWRASGMQNGGLQLIWEGSDAPDRVVLEDAGFEMRPVSGRLVVFEEDGIR